MSLTYKDAGVDVSGADDFVERIGKHVASTHGPEVVKHFSKYAGLIKPVLSGDPMLAATCDGVGTKLLVAREAKKYDGLGQDLVAMSVNDLLPLGARPLLFLDYIAVGKLDLPRMEAIVASIARACRESGCALLGGETAEMPGVYAPDDFDLAGFAVGIVDAQRLPKPETMAAGDVVMALPSTGVHSNGFSLARAALFTRGGHKLSDTPAQLNGVSIGDALLAPTALYVRQVLALLEKVPMRAAAHITGGGLLGRLQKLAPEGLHITVDPKTFDRPAIFNVIQKAAGISDTEMARTFNLGLGFVVIVSPEHAPLAKSQGFLEVGRIERGSGVDLGFAQA